MKPRKVALSIEVFTDAPLKVLKQGAFLLSTGRYELAQEQIDVNVIRAPKPAKSKLTKAGKKAVKRAKAPAKEGILEALRAHHYKEAASEIMTELREKSGLGDAHPGARKLRGKK